MSSSSSSSSRTFMSNAVIIVLQLLGVTTSSLFSLQCTSAFAFAFTPSSFSVTTKSKSLPYSSISTSQKYAIDPSTFTDTLSSAATAAATTTIGTLTDAATAAAAATATATAASSSSSSSLTGVVSTMYTSTLPPLDPDTTNAISTMKDYFIPTSSNDATIKALEGFVQSKTQAASTGTLLPNSSDFIQYDTVMPGAKGVINPSQTFTQKLASTPSPTSTIDKRELNWIAQQFDIYLRKIPFAVTVYALVDFFVLSSNSDNHLMSDELGEDRMGVVADWVNNAIGRVVVLAGIVASILFIENLTFNPVQ